MLTLAVEGPPMTRTNVCFGGAHTYGTAPLTHLEGYRLFVVATRSPGVMGRLLGEWLLGAG